MLDPLGQSQVIPYLKELSSHGVRFTLLSFEMSKAYTREGLGQCEQLRQELATSAIDWHRLRYHKSPSLPATSYDVLAGIRSGVYCISLGGLDRSAATLHERADRFGRGENPTAGTHAVG